VIKAQPRYIPSFGPDIDEFDDGDSPDGTIDYAERIADGFDLLAQDELLEEEEDE